MKPTGVPYSSGALRMLAALVASSDEAVLAKTLDGIITAWNPGAERLYGYSALEAIGQSVRLIVPPEQFPELDVILARLNRGERIEHYETERVRKDGERLTIRVTVYPVKDPTGRIVGASATAREVTGQAPSRQSLHEREEEVRRLVEADVRAAQRALAESESRCRMLAETSHDALILSVNGRVREVNVEFERTFGWSVNEVVGIPITEFADQTVREDVERRIAASIEGSYELIGRHRSGRKLLFEVTARNLLIDGQVGRLTALRDVTEKRQLSCRVREAQKIEALDSALRRTVPLLRRIVGQNISIVLHVAAEPAVVLIDPGQLDRVLLNLAIHARDAMPSGGTLTIGAGQATFEERFVNDQWPSMPGTFAVLAVTDSGGGMNEAPGLSTLFAFVKQHGGFVWVYSTPAQGTSFKVYLPVQRAVATVECRG